jgi:hypothetical protein
MADEQKAKADAQAKADTQPQPQAQPAPAAPAFTGQLPYEAYRAQQTMSDIDQGRALEMDKTVPGGKYINEAGKTVDADGKPLKG